MSRPKVEVKVKDLGWIEWFKRAREIRDRRVRVGVLADTEKGGMHEEGGELTLAEIAGVLEFGTEDGRIPERSVVRSTFDEKREELAKLGEQLMGAVLDGKLDTAKALGLLGAKTAAEMKNKITEGSGVPPPNAPSTIEAKGSDRPWVDTSRLLNAFTWVVEEGE